MVLWLGLGDPKRTEKWPDLGPVHEGLLGEVGLSTGQCHRVQEAGAGEQGCGGQMRLQGGGHQELFQSLLGIASRL